MTHTRRLRPICSDGNSLQTEHNHNHQTSAEDEDEDYEQEVKGGAERGFVYNSWVSFFSFQFSMFLVFFFTSWTYDWRS